MSPDNQKERVPGGGKIKPRASCGKRKRGFRESEDDGEEVEEASIQMVLT